METVSSVATYWDTAALQEKKSLAEAAKGFEAIFVHSMLSSARKGMPEGLFNRSNASKMFYDMFDMQIAQQIAASDTLGLGSFIEDAVSRYTQQPDESDAESSVNLKG